MDNIYQSVELLSRKELNEAVNLALLWQYCGQSTTNRYEELHRGAKHVTPSSQTTENDFSDHSRITVNNTLLRPCYTLHKMYGELTRFFLPSLATVSSHCELDESKRCASDS